MVRLRPCALQRKIGSGAERVPSDNAFPRSDSFAAELI
jgi:hypothetical protein